MAKSAQKGRKLLLQDFYGLEGPFFTYMLMEPRARVEFFFSYYSSLVYFVHLLDCLFSCILKINLKCKLCHISFGGESLQIDYAKVSFLWPLKVHFFSVICGDGQTSRYSDNATHLHHQ